MEVHAHTHTPRKKWTHYFWEFLMLFLAVFCGFLAEYQLEHKIERNRARQYLRSFYDDLHLNITILSRIIDYNKQKIITLDDMSSCYDDLLKNWKSSSCLVQLVKNSSSFITFSFTDGTIEQLKNAGGYRLLKKEDRDSIIFYDKDIRNYKNGESTVFQGSQDIVRNNFSMLLDYRAYKLLNPASPDSLVQTSLLFSANKELLNKFFNDLLRYKQNMSWQSDWVSFLRERTAGLIEYFKAKYHFE